MTVKAVRVSKTSFKSWTLHGPIDQALKTTCQANAVKAVSIHLDDVHGKPVDVELWLSTEVACVDHDEINPPAQIMLYVAQGGTSDSGLAEAFEKVDPVKGVAVLTGPGGTDFPTGDIECTLHALLGQHSDEGPNPLNN